MWTKCGKSGFAWKSQDITRDYAQKTENQTM